MRKMLLVSVIVVFPALSCINDGELPMREKEFHERYQPYTPERRSVEPSERREDGRINWAGTGTSLILLAGLSLAFVSSRSKPNQLSNPSG